MGTTLGSWLPITVCNLPFLSGSHLVYCSHIATIKYQYFAVVVTNGLLHYITILILLQLALSKQKVHSANPEMYVYTPF
jgi:hypothetical protein